MDGGHKTYANSTVLAKDDLSAIDPPPLKWSDLKYVFGIKEDCYGEETVHA